MNCPSCIYPDLEEILKKAKELDVYEKESFDVPDESSKYYDPEELYRFYKCSNCNYINKKED